MSKSATQSKLKRVHYFQHVEFEGLGNIEPLLAADNCKLESTRWFAGEQAPACDSYDLLIVMGGPMGIFDYELYPWLKAEKLALKAAIEAGKKVLGVCLGAQLLADVLGASVSKNAVREIGWFALQSSPELQSSSWGKVFPECFEPLHWHGDTFAIPLGALPVGSSEACANQGFILEDRIVALQFHLELAPSAVATLCVACADELDGSAFVQSPAQMLAADCNFAASKAILRPLITRLLC